MDQDTFIEEMVKKRSSGKDKLLKVLIVVGALFVSYLCTMVLPFIGGGMLMAFYSIFLLLGVGALVGAWYLVTSMNVEFEYTFTNGELDVDKIIARRRRKRLITVKVSTFEKFGKYDPRTVSQLNVTNKIFANSDPSGANAWYAVFSHPKTGLTLLVFDDVERLTNAFKRYIPRNLSFEIFGRV